jgi:hypothetical protein
MVFALQLNATLIRGKDSSRKQYLHRNPKNPDCNRCGRFKVSSTHLNFQPNLIFSEFPRSLSQAQWEFFHVITQEEDIIEKKLVNLPQLPLYIA